MKLTLLKKHHIQRLLNHFEELDQCDYCYGDGKCYKCTWHVGADEECPLCEGYNFCIQCNGTGEAYD